ncbi:MAG: PEP-CTERM sorting domain-containing protein [Bryobacteraceae bacterium]
MTLALKGLPAHTEATVSLALFILNSWDGNDARYGPDYWRMAVAGGPTVLYTTLANIYHYPGDNQSYPDPYPAAHPYLTGAAEVNTLGTWWNPEAIYLLSFTFPHTDPNLTLTFEAWNLMEWLPSYSDEGWALNNLRVEVTGTPQQVVPEPASFILLAGVLGMIGANLVRRRATR